MFVRWLVISGFSTAATLAAPDLSFKPAPPDGFTFDTGKLSGRLLVAEKGAGIVSMVDQASGTQLTRGHANYGILSHYRMLSPKKRWGEVIWEHRKSAAVQADGSLRIDWPAREDCPAELSAVYQWVSPDTLEVLTIVTPRQSMPKLEVFVGSYFNENTKSLIYLSPARYGSGKPQFVLAAVHPLTVGTYLSFPRDLKAAQLVFDGRWEQGLHPVQWSISRYLAAPLALRQDTKTGITMVLMSPPRDCFAAYCSYNQPPPVDGVGNHYSTYLSLFGRDLPAGQAARALMRLVVRKNASPQEVLKIYDEFAGSRK